MSRAWQVLQRSWGTIIGVAAGVSVASSVLLLVYAALFRPLPYPDAGRLFVVWDADESSGQRRISYDLIERIRMTSNMVDAGSYAKVRTGVAFGTSRAQAQVESALVSRSVLSMLGAAPALGRLFDIGDGAPSAPPSAIVSERLTHRLGATISLGDRITVSGTPHIVVGILPADFIFPDHQTDLWTLLALPPGSGLSAQALVRSSSDVAVGTQLTLQRAASSSGRTAPRLQVAPLAQMMIGDLRPTLWLLQSAALTLLAVATLAAAWALSTRTWDRRKSYVLRGALGAPMSRIVAHYFHDIAIIATWTTALSTAVAVLLIVPVFRGWRAYLPHATLNSGALLPGVCCLLSFATITAASVPGLLIALRASGTRQMATGLRGVGRGAARHIALGMQVTLVFALCVFTAWSSLALRRLLSMNVGLSEQRLSFVRMDTPPAGVSQASTYVARLLQFERDLQASGGRIALTNVFPLSDEDQFTSVTLPDRAGNYGVSYEMVRIQAVSREFFSVVGLRCVLGSCQTSGPEAGHQAVVNEAFVQRFSQDRSLIGTRVQASISEWTIVGVVKSTTHASLFETPQPEIFVDYSAVNRLAPAGAEMAAVRVFLVSAVSDSHPAWPAYVASGRRAFPEAEFGRPTSFGRLVWDSTGYRPLLVGCAMVLALAAGVVLIGSVQAFISRELAYRRREFGIRQALGGAPAAILLRHFNRLLMAALVGCVAGTAIASLGVNLLNAQVYVPHSLTTVSPLVLGVAGTVCVAGMLLAALAVHAGTLVRGTIADVLRIE